jgi:hypothetical protein
MVLLYFIGHVLVSIKLGLINESIVDLVDPAFGKVVWWIQGLAQIASSPLNGGFQQPRYTKRLDRCRSMSRDLIRTFDWQQNAMLH